MNLRNQLTSDDDMQDTDKQQNSSGEKQGEDTSEFHKRVKYYETKRQQNIQSLKDRHVEKLNKELEKCTFKPKLNSNRLEKRTVDDLQIWNKTAREKIHKKRKEVETSERTRFNKTGPKQYGPKVHARKRFVELHEGEAVPMTNNLDLVEDRLNDFKSNLHNKNKEREVLLTNHLHEINIHSTGVTEVNLRDKSTHSRHQQMAKSKDEAHQKVVANVVIERSKLKALIQKHKETTKTEDVNYVSMNMTKMNTSTNWKQRETALNVIKTLKSQVRSEILS